MKIFCSALFAIFAISICVSAQTNIHKFDFENFTYSSVFCGDEGKPTDIKVLNGRFEKKSGDEYLRLEVQSVNYGDLSGDGKDEAVIITVCNTGGTGQFSEGYIYSIKNNKPALTGRIAGGDRAGGGLVSAKIENGLLVVESNEEGGSGLCCPEFIVTDKFRLNGNKLVDAVKPTRKVLYPAKRISFPRGASNFTLTTEIPASDHKRFVVKAGKGQTLTVKTNQKDSPIYIHSGDADEVQNENGLVAKLLDNGDFSFDVFNNNDQTLTYSITVEIK